MELLGIAGDVCSQPAVAKNYEWKVENFFSLSETQGNYYHSPDIEFSGLTFHFRLHPNRWDDSIVLYLLLKTPSPPITILYTLGIKTAAGDTKMQKSGTHKFSKPTDFVYHECVKRSELMNRRLELAPGDAVTFKASLMIDDSRSDIGTRHVAVPATVGYTLGQGANGRRYALENADTTDVAVQTCQEDVIDQDGNGSHQTLEKTDFATFCQNIEELKGKDSDVTLEVRGMRFRVHRFILEVRTPALAAMFSDNASVAETGVVCVEDCHPEAFEVFLRFVYSGVVENLTIENVTDVYYVANKYDHPRLKKECVQHMLSNLTTGSVCSIIDTAHRHGEEVLQERASDFLVENAREVFRTAVWHKFIEENSLAYDLIVRVHKNWK